MTKIGLKNKKYALGSRSNNVSGYFCWDMYTVVKIHIFPSLKSYPFLSFNLYKAIIAKQNNKCSVAQNKSFLR